MSTDIDFGYDLDFWKRYSKKIPIKIDINICPHLLIAGKSGSGKSYGMLFIIGKLLQSGMDIELFILDFKCSSDFQFLLNNYKNFYNGDGCIDGLRKFYQIFSDIRENQNDCSKRYMLIFDEYPAFIHYLESVHDASKSKVSKEMKGIIAELLMLGRGVGKGFNVWLINQRSDAKIYNDGVRDNFHIKISFLMPSKELRGMIFNGVEIDTERVFQKGEGVLVSDLTGLRYVKFPLICNLDAWKSHILEALLSRM